MIDIMYLYKYKQRSIPPWFLIFYYYGRETYVHRSCQVLLMVMITDYYLIKFMLEN